MLFGNGRFEFLLELQLMLALLKMCFNLDSRRTAFGMVLCAYPKRVRIRTVLD